MRLWSLHPKYLDRQGLVALWREALLAQSVLEGKTVGYRAHPQLERFRSKDEPLDYLRSYMYHIVEEAKGRGYSFDETKIGRIYSTSPQMIPIEVTKDQLEYEMNHLERKLQARSPEHLDSIDRFNVIEPFPGFKVVKGSVASWEKLKDAN